MLCDAPGVGAGGRAAGAVRDPDHRFARGTLWPMSRQNPPERVRDVPSPKSVRGLFGPVFRLLFAWPYRWGLLGLYRMGFRPWQVTLLSLVGNAAAGWLLLTGARLVPAFVMLAAGVLDVMDGGIARLRGEASRSGAFLDSVLDRVSDMIIFGCLFWSLSGQGHTLTAALSLAALVASFMVSHVRAEAEARGLSLTEGMVQRFERYLALTIGLTVPGALVWMLALLTLLGGLTVVQRAATAWSQLTPRS